MPSIEQIEASTCPECKTKGYWVWEDVKTNQPVGSSINKTAIEQKLFCGHCSREWDFPDEPEEVVIKRHKKEFMERNAESLRNALTKTKTQFMVEKNAMFLLSEIFSMPISYSVDLPEHKTWTNGKDIKLDPEFFSALTVYQRMYALAHMTMHRMFMHLDKSRRGKREDKLWDLAADISTSAMMAIANIGDPLPDSIHVDYDGTVKLNINGKMLSIAEAHKKSVEEIYFEMVNHAQQNPMPAGAKADVITDEKGNKIEMPDEHGGGELSDEERTDAQNSMRQKLVEHKMRGNLPGWMADKIEGMLEGKVNWQAEMREMIMPEIKSYMTFSRTNRRGMASGMILPGMKKEGLDVVFAMDCSGSMGTPEKQYTIGEIDNMFNQFEPGMVKAKLLLHDTEVYQEVDIENLSELHNSDLQDRGGGTSHLDVFERAEDSNAKVLICFTDGYSEFPSETKIQKVLWIVTNKHGLEMIPEHLGKKIFVDPSDLS